MKCVKLTSKNYSYFYQGVCLTQKSPTAVVSDELADEMAKLGRVAVSAVDEATPDATAQATPKELPDLSKLDSMNKSELVSVATALGVNIATCRTNEERISAIKAGV